MEKEKANITVQSTEKGLANVIVTHLDKPAHMYEPLPKRIEIDGSLQVVPEFLTKRGTDAPAKESRIEVDREAGKITLLTLDTHPYAGGTVQGCLTFSEIFTKFKINEPSHSRKPIEMAQLFKMSRFYFPDLNENMTLVSALTSFEAKVDQHIEKARKENGSMKDNFSAVVYTNLPPSFSLTMPIFKGTEPETFEVEFYATINGREVSLSLISPGANMAAQKVISTAIDDTIKQIREINPDMAILLIS